MAAAGLRDLIAKLAPADQAKLRVAWMYVQLYAIDVEYLIVVCVCVCVLLWLHG